MRHSTPMNDNIFAPAGIHLLKIVSIKDRKDKNGKAYHGFCNKVQRSWDFQGNPLEEAYRDATVFENLREGWLIQKFAEQLGFTLDSEGKDLLWEDSDFVKQEYIGIVVKAVGEKDGKKVEYTNIRGHFHKETPLSEIVEYCQQNGLKAEPVGPDPSGMGEQPDDGNLGF